MRYLFAFVFLLSIISTNYLFALENPNLEASEGYVTVNGGKMWYRILGEGKETPLLMMHGGPGGTSQSFYLYEKLTKDRPIIMFDQLGSGRSDQHQDTSILKVPEFVQQVADLKAHLGLNQFYLYGHSWGTALALEYYSEYPEGVQGIIFNSPYFSTEIWEADADTLIFELHDTIQSAIKKGELSGDFDSKDYKNANTVFAKNYGLRGKYRRSKLNTKPTRGNYFIYNYMWGPTEFTATGTLKNYDAIAKLKKVRVPTLFITGEFDEARPATVRRFQKMVPSSKVAIVKGAGHSTMHDNLRQNRKAILKFLRLLEK